MFLLKKILNSWFDDSFFGNSRFSIFLHSVENYRIFLSQIFREIKVGHFITLTAFEFWLLWILALFESWNSPTWIIRALLNFGKNSTWTSRCSKIDFTQKLNDKKTCNLVSLFVQYWFNVKLIFYLLSRFLETPTYKYSMENVLLPWFFREIDNDTFLMGKVI